MVFRVEAVVFGAASFYGGFVAGELGREVVVANVASDGFDVVLGSLGPRIGPIKGSNEPPWVCPQGPVRDGAESKIKRP
ncbi:MAG: hypothetical protein ACYDDF_09810 [Thermoplasmatota archaeon]